MTPVPSKPVVVILLSRNNDVLNISNNISPELNVTVTISPEYFEKKSFGNPYEQAESNYFPGN